MKDQAKLEREALRLAVADARAKADAAAAGDGTPFGIALLVDIVLVAREVVLGGDFDGGFIAERTWPKSRCLRCAQVEAA